MTDSQSDKTNQVQSILESKHREMEGTEHMKNKNTQLGATWLFRATYYSMCIQRTPLLFYIPACDLCKLYIFR